MFRYFFIFCSNIIDIQKYNIIKNMFCQKYEIKKSVLICFEKSAKKNMLRYVLRKICYKKEYVLHILFNSFTSNETIGLPPVVIVPQDSEKVNYFSFSAFLSFLALDLIGSSFLYFLA